MLATFLCCNASSTENGGSDEAKALSQKSNYLSPRFESAVASGMVEEAYGNTVEAERQLDMVITETRRLGFSGYELEARLQRGFVELNPVKGELGRLTSKSLRKDAAATGYRLIARKAHVPLV